MHRDDPRRHPDPGRHVRVDRSRAPILLVGYTLGLGIPFLAIGLVYDRAPAVLRPLQRHAHAMSVIGGLLVAAIGVAMLFDLARAACRATSSS